MPANEEAKAEASKVTCVIMYKEDDTLESSRELEATCRLVLDDLHFSSQYEI